MKYLEILHREESAFIRTSKIKSILQSDDFLYIHHGGGEALGYSCQKEKDAKKAYGAIKEFMVKDTKESVESIIMRIDLNGNGKMFSYAVIEKVGENQVTCLQAKTSS